MVTTSLREEFQKAKKEIINRVKDGVKSYDVTKMTHMSTDWSKLGVEFLMIQNHCDCELKEAPACCKEVFKLVFARRKKCSDAESRYAPIDGKALGVVFSL